MHSVYHARIHRTHLCVMCFRYSFTNWTFSLHPLTNLFKHIYFSNLHFGDFNCSMKIALLAKLLHTSHFPPQHCKHHRSSTPIKYRHVTFMDLTDKAAYRMWKKNSFVHLPSYFFSLIFFVFSLKTKSLVFCLNF